MTGWIKLHRKILDNPVATKDADHLAVWIYLLLNASHQEHDTIWQGQRTTLQPGQLITGRKKIAQELKISESKVQRIIKTLKNEHQIEQQVNSRGSLISIINWNKYQLTEQPTEQKVNSNRTASEQQLDTIQEYKELKNDKETNKRYINQAEKNGLSVREYLRLKSKGEIR